MSQKGNKPFWLLQRFRNARKNKSKKQNEEDDDSEPKPKKQRVKRTKKGGPSPGKKYSKPDEGDEGKF